MSKTTTSQMNPPAPKMHPGPCESAISSTVAASCDDYNNGCEEGTESSEDRRGSVQSQGQERFYIGNFSDETEYSGCFRTSAPPSQESEECHAQVINESDGTGESGYGSSGVQGESPQCDFYVDSRTLQKADPQCPYKLRVLYSLCRTTGPSRSVPDLIKLLKKDLDFSEHSKLRKDVHKILPQLMKEKGWADVASFLKLDDHRASAIATLETMLMALRKCQDTTVRDQLLQVSLTCKEVILFLGDKSPDLLPMLTVLLMTVSALISRCPHPDHDQFSQLAIAKKLKKSKGGEGLKHIVLKTYQLFLEGVDKELEHPGSLQDCTRPELWQTSQEKTRKVSAGVYLSEMVVMVFSLLNEVKSLGWNKRGEDLLNILKKAISSKSSLNEECKGPFGFFLARQLVLLLETTFEEEKPQVGSHTYKHQELISGMLVDITENTSSTVVRGCVLEEIKSLPFHQATNVRQYFNCFWRNEQPLCVLAQRYLATKLQIVGFQELGPFTPRSSENSVHQNCRWKEFTCTVDKKPAEGAMYIRKASCLSDDQRSNDDQLERCLHEHPGCDVECEKGRHALQEESRKHIQSLEVLRKLSPHSDHLVKLWVYQYLPFPVYITEQVSGNRLLDLLLAHRNAQEWLATPRLVMIAQQIVQAFMFLSSKHIDPRGVTCYSIMVQSGSGADVGPLTSETRCSVLSGRLFTVKFTDMGLAHEYNSNDPVYNTVNHRPVDEQGPVPVRWVAPEALFEGRYGEKNMTYNTGTLMNELWNHGAQPFSSYDASMATEELLMKMLTQPGTVELASRPCIPDHVCRLITQYTHHNPDNRPTLDTVFKTLSNPLVMGNQNAQVPDLARALSQKKKYPNISLDQRNRHHIPETGIPKSVQDVLHAGKKSELYWKAYSRTTVVPCSKNVVTDEELIAHDWIKISHQADRTVVEEVFSEHFVRDVLPSVRAGDQYGVTCYKLSEQSAPKLRKKDGLTVHTREYDPSVTLERAARDRLLWDSQDPSSVYDEVDADLSFLKPFVSLARAVRDLHVNQWIQRDLREEHILVDKRSGEVTLARVGRMRRLPLGDSYILDEVSVDSVRRAAPETLISGQCTKKSDVHLLGTVMRQVFRIADIARVNPSATRRDFAPFPNITKDKLIDYVRDPNQEEEMYPLCPIWLHDLIWQCRHPDPDKRPTAEEVYNTLLQHWTYDLERTPFIKDPSAVEANDRLYLSLVRRPNQQSKGRHSRFWGIGRSFLGQLKGKVRTTLQPRDAAIRNSCPNVALCSEETQVKTPLLDSATGPAPFSMGMTDDAQTDFMLTSSQAYSGAVSPDGHVMRDPVSRNSFAPHHSEQSLPRFPSEMSSQQPKQQGTVESTVYSTISHSGRCLETRKETDRDDVSFLNVDRVNGCQQSGHTASKDAHCLTSPRNRNQDLSSVQHRKSPGTLPPAPQAEYDQHGVHERRLFSLRHPISLPRAEQSAYDAMENLGSECYDFIPAEERFEDAYEAVSFEEYPGQTSKENVEGQQTGPFTKSCKDQAGSDTTYDLPTYCGHLGSALPVSTFDLRGYCSEHAQSQPSLVCTGPRSSRQVATAKTVTPAARQGVATSAVTPAVRQMGSVNDHRRRFAMGRTGNRASTSVWDTQAFLFDSLNPGNSQLVPVNSDAELEEICEETFFV